MTQPKPEDATKEEPEIDLNDPDDYHRRQRLKQIHHRREEVSKTLDRANRYTKKNEHEEQKSALSDAVTLYIAELEPLIERTEASPELPDNMPWDSVTEFADKLGTHEQSGERKKAHYAHSLKIFRACNQYLAEVRPLITEDDSDEWEV